MAVGWWVASLQLSQDTDPTRATSPPAFAGKRQFSSDSPITYTVSIVIHLPKDIRQYINSNLVFSDLNFWALYSEIATVEVVKPRIIFILFAISAALTSFTLTVVIGLIVSAVPSSPSVARSGQKLNIC